jgi:nucleoside-diphosphate-sugar epimerase
MRVLVIGGTGFIGSWITAQLLEQGAQAIVLHRGRRGADALPRGAVSVISDAPLGAAASYESALRQGEPDAAIHVLAMVEADATAAVSVLSGRAGRAVLISSGDVYRAYGRFIRTEPGTAEPTPLHADASPLRERLYPYRTPDTPPGSLAHDYDKILVERAFRAAPSLPAVVLRLPKVYGAGGNGDLATVYGFAAHPRWRWTHGYVENVAFAAALAARHPDAPGRTYNVGEETTPTVAERLAHLPPRPPTPSIAGDHDFTQDMAYDTGPIRRELGYREIVDYEEGLRRTLGS